MKKENGDLIPNFKKSIFDSAVELSTDWLEIPLDCIIQNDLAKDIPIVSTVVGIGKTAVAVRDMHLLKKMIVFIAKINDGTISQEELRNHREKLERDKKKLNKEIERLIIILDHITETKKAYVLGNMYIKYMNEEIEFDWEDFCIFAEILERLSIYDYQSLIDLYYKKIIKPEDNYNPLALSRIQSMGLINYMSGMRVQSNKEEFIAQINSLGEFFVEIVFMDENKRIIITD